MTLRCRGRCPPPLPSSHLLSNMHSLVTVAPLVQAALGRRRFVLLYVGGGLAASLTSVLFNRARGASALDAAA